MFFDLRTFRSNKNYFVIYENTSSSTILYINTFSFRQLIIIMLKVMTQTKQQQETTGRLKLTKLPRDTYFSQIFKKNNICKYTQNASGLNFKVRSSPRIWRGFRKTRRVGENSKFKSSYENRRKKLEELESELTDFDLDQLKGGTGSAGADIAHNQPVTKGSEDCCNSW